MCIYLTSQLWAECDTRSIFKREKLVWIQCLLFYLAEREREKEREREREREKIDSSRPLDWSEVQTVSSSFEFELLSKESSSTIFWVFGMTRPWSEPRFWTIGEHSNHHANVGSNHFITEQKWLDHIGLLPDTVLIVECLIGCDGHLWCEESSHKEVVNMLNNDIEVSEFELEPYY